MAGETVAWAPGSTDPKVAFAEFKLHLRTITPRLYVVPTLIALNVLVYAAMVAMGVSPMSPTVVDALHWGADYGPLTQDGQIWRLLTNIFVHFGAIHLCANMLALASSGPIIERLFGGVAFAGLYLVAGITGSLTSLAVHPVTVSAGASGAIFGIYGALGAVVVLHRNAIPRVVLSKLGGVAGSFVAYNIAFGFGHAGIDNAAHLGGLLGGVVAGALLFQPLVEGRPLALRQPALLVVAAGLLAFCVVHVLPRSVTVDQIVRDFSGDESRLLDAYNDLLDKMKKGETDMGGAANQLEQQILPGWRQARAKLEGQSRGLRGRQQPTASQERALELLREIAALRDDAWSQMIGALRANDAKQFAAISHESEQKVHGIIQEIKNLDAD
jgi:rhomboid protease GluP